jgi:hypothetical protein
LETHGKPLIINVSGWCRSKHERAKRASTSTTATLNDNKTAWINAEPRYSLQILPKNAAIVTFTDTLLQKLLRTGPVWLAG